jgi:RDD family
MMSASTTGSTHRLTDEDAASPIEGAAGDAAASEPNGDAVANSAVESNSNSESDVQSTSDSWRVEVAARLERYRTRRKPRTPRYPSLLLPFDAPESWSRPALPRPGQDAAVQSLEDPPRTPAPLSLEGNLAPELARHSFPELALEQSAKVIEFPRSAAIPVFRASELAEPVFDRPRIVEAPEILPPPPALGGMTIEAVDREPTEATDCPGLPSSASILRRTFAAAVDGLVLGTALAAFAAIFLRLNPVRGPLLLLGGALAAVVVLLWMAYEFLFVVYTGTTLGLRAMRLQLTTFDGLPLNRGRRRWRVLASLLSTLSLGLGYLWCVLDQDGLCWHDRISRSYLQVIPKIEKIS